MWVEQRTRGFRAFERYKDPINGKLVKVSVKMPKNTPQERTKAQRKLDAIVAEKTNIVPDVIYLSQLKAFYLREMKITQKNSTYKRNESACNTFLKILGDVDMNSLNARYVKQKFLKHRNNPTSFNEYMGRFKTLVRWGYRNDFLSDISYIDKIGRMQDKSKREKVQDKFLEKEEVNRLIDAMLPHWALLTRFLVLSGCRIGEVLALTPADFDFKNRTINVSKTFNPSTRQITTPKTESSDDTIAMQDELYEVCKEFKGDFMATLGYKATYDAYRKHLREVGEKVLGRKLTPHILRHTHASLLAEQGLSYELIQRRLRHHENSRVTREIYIHITDRLKEKDKAILKEIKLVGK